MHAYSYGADDGGEMRKRIAGAVDRFVDVGPLSDSAAAQAIHRDGIDILIDLKGFTQNSRTSILALHPAPIQVNYLGYPGTLGPGLCDYIITDSFVTPTASAGDYSECFAELPHSYQPRGRARVVGAAPSRASVGPARGRRRLLLLQPGLQIHAGNIRHLVPAARIRARQRPLAARRA